VQAGDVLAFVTPPFQAITSPTCARRPASPTDFTRHS
jgi:hypothetical protein